MNTQEKIPLFRSFPSIPEEYTIDKQGYIYKSDIRQDEKKIYSFKTKSGTIKKYSIKKLYRAVFNLEYSIDKIQSLQGEEWKAIPNSSSRYFISSYGRIKSLCGYETKLLKPTVTRYGYLRVSILDGDFLVHRLVAQAFIPNTDETADTVHHKDRNRQNNKVSNLQWLSRSENSRIAQQQKKQCTTYHIKNE